MQFFFADDSTQRCSRKGMQSVLGFGGILVDAAQVRDLGVSVDKFAKDAGIPVGEEIKWSPHRDTWIYKNLHDDDRFHCYSAILDAARDAGCKVVVSVCEPGVRNIRPEWGFERCVDYSLERVTNCLKDTGEDVIVIADRPGGGLRNTEEFLSDHIERVRSDFNHMSAEAFAMTLLTAPSRFVRQLQVADLVVGATTAMVSGQSRYAEPYFDTIKAMMICNTLGYVGGTGLKVYPDQLINLYHWVLGETAFVKSGRGGGYRLPHPNHWYHENDGT
jgi:hypothetical protein